MHPAYISLTDPIRDVAGHYQAASDYTDRPVVTLRLETVVGVELTLHFADLAGLERFREQVSRAVAGILQQQEKRRTA